MIVAGGVYIERCVLPDTTRLLGSGGRAALALSSFRRDIVLHTFHPPQLWGDLEANFRPYGIGCHPYVSDERIAFSYLFPLGRPEQSPEALGRRRKEIISGRDILSFGCVEGDFVLRCDAAVFDPQSGSRGFRETGSQANRLAIVLNRGEVTSLTGQPAIGEAAAHLLAAQRAAAVVVKDGPNGAVVFTATAAPESVPAYSSSALYKIGSGDIFTAIFAHEWLSGMEPCRAADLASRHTAAYVESPVLPLHCELPSQVPRSTVPINHVALVGETDTIARTWFLSILRDTLHQLGTPFVEIVEISDYIRMLGENHKPDESRSMLFCVDNENAAMRLLSTNDLDKGNPVIFADPRAQSCFRGRAELRVFCDLSQALYEVYWMPT